MKFSEFSFHTELLEALDYMGFTKATEIQEKAIPIIQEGHDMIACAQTGTGKTAAFILPVLNKLAFTSSDTVNTLVIAPTRELALQIDQQIQGFAYFLNVSSISVYGGGDGADFEDQKRALKRGTNIIVATPGKLISHLQMKNIKFDKLEHLILDEADRMLDMGFREDILMIISHLPKERQTLMFSATMPPKIRDLAAKTLKNPQEVTIALSKPATGVLQGVYLVHNHQKSELVHRLISDKPQYKSILIFSSTKKKVFEISRALKTRGHDVEGISSDLTQKEREDVLSRFRSRRTRILVATDVLSRGIDIKEIHLVINYDVPSNAEDYVHRVGRTARADTTGVALTLVNEDDMSDFRDIERLIGSEVMKLPPMQGMGEGPKWNPDRKRQTYRSGGRRSQGKSRSNKHSRRKR
jgi:superfamily II DNA/RNA helicase